MPYEASQIDSEMPEDSTPKIVSFRLHSQLLVIPVNRVILGGTYSASWPYTAITATEQWPSHTRTITEPT